LEKAENCFKMDICLISLEYPDGLLIPVDNRFGKRIILKVGAGINGNIIYSYSKFNDDNQCVGGGGGGGGSKSRGDDVRKLIKDLYAKNFIEEASDVFIANYFGFDLSDLDESSDSDLEVCFLDDIKTDCQNSSSSSDQDRSSGGGETKNQQRIIRMEEP
jgi:hypothetical protein